MLRKSVQVHYLAHGRIGETPLDLPAQSRLRLTSLFSGDYVVKKPMVLGHESAGIVFQGRLQSVFANPLLSQVHFQLARALHISNLAHVSQSNQVRLAESVRVVKLASMR